MEKQTVIKIIGSAIIFIFAVFFLQTISPQASAATDGLNWENPNKSGNNPYKFKPQDVLNSELMMQVVGCTGVVDKVSEALTGLFQKKAQEKIDEIERKAIIEACRGVKSGTLMASSPAPGVTAALNYEIDCRDILETNDAKQHLETIAIAKQNASVKRTNECFNGIAITLARNQLTAMTRYTMNWVNTGFNGDPMYVRNITSFTDKLERNVIETGVKILISPNNAYPYGDAFAQSALRGYSSGRSFRSGADNFLYSLTSDLSNFITDPRSYYSERNLDKANGANDAFANDFSTGGWDGWLALTQKDQNNPLGFAMQTSQYLADQQANQLAGVKEELLTNNGFLSQKRCVLWNMVDEDTGDYIYNSEGDNLNYVLDFDEIKTTTNPQPQDECAEYEVVTPGSLIKDKVSYYINSPERQLELADTINESLNALFSALIAKFQDQGLSSLSAERYIYSDDDMGLGYGDNSTMFGDDNLGSGYTDSFNLTRDLGNTYIYNYTQKSLGSWNAKNNIPELHIGVGPFDNEGKPLTNVYYNVSVAGNTKLIKEGYNGWAVGDRAFWNGKEWQNWKCGADRRTGRCINQTNPIKDRGVVQIQSDYVVAAKELLSNLPSIMPKIGELDYCIPGPNPNWRVNSGDAYANFSDYAYSLNSEFKDGKFLIKRDSTTFSIAQLGDKEYDDYKAIFDNTTPLLWEAVTQTYDWKLLKYYGGGTFKKDKEENETQKQVNKILNNVSSKLQEFYSQYEELIDNLYGEDSLMQRPYLENESTSALLPNSSYLPMAETGLNITKDIVFYDEDIATMTQAYKDSIVQANSNIYKLNKIKDDVSIIIKAAQKRRDDNMRRILNEEAVRNGTPVLTEAQYKIKYQNCLDEEDITFYDDTDIMSGTGGEEGRCDDDLDNDLDGLIDERDSDCSGITIPVVPVRR